MTIHKAVVVGSGMMGPGIAGTIALAGIETTILARSPEKTAPALAQAAGQLRLIAPPDTAEAAINRISCHTDSAAACATADLVIESIPENMRLKQEWIASIERQVRPDTIVTSNTSGLSITVMSEGAQHPERIATTHFWNPPHLMPLVEIVRSPHTTDDVVETLRALLIRGGKVPVVVKKDRPGQLGNRLQMAMVREAVSIVEQGIADPADVDLAASLGFGLRLPVYGVLEHQDIVGRDAFQVCNYVAGDLYNEPQAPPLYQQMQAEERLGVGPGRGFHDWTVKDVQAVKARRDQWLLDFLRGPYAPKRGAE
jgi:3-hydroxybutyryl-CoA dehydrogenase